MVEQLCSLLGLNYEIVQVGAYVAQAVLLLSLCMFALVGGCEAMWSVAGVHPDQDKPQPPEGQ
ncbi:MAG: hypothetical protein Q7S43_00305 [bacterium]|nr:hypothetical protein [bacterium]